MAGRRDLLHDFRVPASVLADWEEYRLGALISQRLEYCRRVARPRTIVEGEHDLVVLQKIVGLEMLKAETGAARGIDLNHTGNAEGVGIVALGCWGGRGGRG